MDEVVNSVGVSQSERLRSPYAVLENALMVPTISPKRLLTAPWLNGVLGLVRSLGLLKTAKYARQHLPDQAENVRASRVHHAHSHLGIGPILTISRQSIRVSGKAEARLENSIKNLMPGTK